MSVHAFNCYIGRDPDQYSVSEIETAFNGWVESNGEWVDDDDDHHLTTLNTEDDGSGKVYYGSMVRFVPDHTKNNLIQKFSDKMDNKVAWYRVGYHACTHRDGDGSTGRCGWDDSVEATFSGYSIPPGVPTFL